MRRVWLLPLALLAACTDEVVVPSGVSQPQASLQSGSSIYFTFTSPISQAQSAGTEYNPNLATVVEVCRVVSGDCAELVKSFYPTETGDPALGIVAGPDQYHVNWKLGDSPLVSGQLYRIGVLTGPSSQATSLLLGTIDVYVDAGTARVLDPATGLVVASYTLSQTLPIKYRAFRGLLCETAEIDTTTEPCLEGWVDYRGGTLVVETELAGISFPEGAIPESYGRVNVVIEKYESPDGTESCIPVTYPQYTGCYQFRLTPHVPQFDEEVLVGVCPDPAVIAIEEQLDMWKWDEVDPATAQPMPRRIVHFLECPGWSSPAPSPDPLPGLSLVRKAAQPLLALLTPAPVHAATISPFGCGIHDLSRFGWVRTLALSKVQGDGETAVVGSAVEPAPTVRVTANAEKVRGQGIPVGGIPIAFVAGGPDDSVNPAYATTNALGLAATQWTLGQQPGGYTMTATASNPLSGFPNLSGAWGSVVFGATAVEPTLTSYAVSFLSPVVKGGGSGGTIGGLPVRVEICRVSGTSCTLVSTLTAPTTLVLKQRFYQGSWQTTGVQNGRYRLRVLVNGVQVGGVELEAVRNPSNTGTEPVQFKPGQNIEMKFALALQ